jgi:hypothetical protein
MVHIPLRCGFIDVLPVGGEEDLRRLFRSAVDWAAVRAGTDFSQGFADVRDAAFAARVEAVGAVPREIVRDGVLAEGNCCVCR